MWVAWLIVVVVVVVVLYWYDLHYDVCGVGEVGDVGVVGFCVCFVYDV